MRKRIISIILCVFMVLSLLPTSAFAADVVVSGDFGAYGSGTWSLDSDGLLSISGEVGMPGGYSYAPWLSYYRMSIKSISFASDAYAKEGAKLDYLFHGLSSLTSIDLTGFNTSKATSMSNMFYNCTKLATIILPSSFNTSKVTNMSAMFKNCSELTALDLSSFSTSAVTDMSEMFYGCAKLAALALSSSFNTSKVANMSAMFKNCSELTALDLSSFSTSAVTNMKEMFYSCKALTSLNLSSFDTSDVTTMESIFFDCAELAALTLSSSFNTSAVTNMKEMFYGTKLTSLDFSSFDTSNVENMRGMFKYCSALTSLDLSGFNTSKVTDMKEMFYGCKALTSLNLSSFDTSKVTTMESMFSGNIELTVLTLSSSFKTANVTRMDNMFFNCKVLASLDLSSFDTSKSTDMQGMFKECNTLASIALSSSFDTSAVTDMTEMFYNCKALTSIDLSSFNTSDVTKMSNMFYGCVCLSSLDLSSFNTSAVTNMAKMFSDCESLNTLTLPSTFTTSNVEHMGYMFYRCKALTALDVSSFDTSKVKNMSNMFNGCESLTSLALPSTFTTPKVTDMSRMFANCDELTSLNLSRFNTSEVTNMSLMFNNCKNLTSLDLSSFNTSKVTDMSGMFSNCSELTSIDLSSFNTSKVTDMSNMFINCINLESLTLSSSFDTSAVKKMGLMFFHCNALTNLNLSCFSTESATSMDNMFKYCCSLAGNENAVQGYARTVEDAEKFNNSSLTGISSSNLVFTVPTYTITLHANNGSNETVTVENLGGSYILPECSFEVLGLIRFVGWAYSENGSVIEGSDIILMDNTDLYAIWEVVSHTHEFVHHDAKAPTCTEIGWYEYGVCSLCNYSTRVEIPATDHNYAFSSFVWDGFTAKAVYVCGNDSAHTQEFDATVTSVLSSENICEEGGEITYTATYIGKDGTHTDTKTEVITATGHSCNEKWESDGTNHWHVCSVCGAKVNETAHRGGVATCTSRAVCNICAAEYGEPQEHNYVWLRYMDEEHHQHICTFCQDQTDVGEHYGGNATCSSLAKCEACGFTYGGYADHIPDESEWLSNEYGHWYKCSNSDCGEKLDFSAHTPDYYEATEEHGMTCTTCGYAIKEALVPVSIEIACVPTKISYMVGDAVSTAGLSVTVSYSNGSKAYVTTSVSVTDFNTTAVGDKTATVSYKGLTAAFDYTVIPKPTIKIQNNSGSKTINYGEGIKLTAIATDLPEGAQIKWYVNGAEKETGKDFTFSDAKENATITVKIVDKDGKVIKDSSGGEISEGEKITVKAGFFQKLISFFKNLFKVNRIIAQAFIKENKQL